MKDMTPETSPQKQTSEQYLLREALRVLRRVDAVDEIANFLMADEAADVLLTITALEKELGESSYELEDETEPPVPVPSFSQGEWKVEHRQDVPHVVASQGLGWANPIICILYEDVTPEDSVTLGAWLEPLPNAEANSRLIVQAPSMFDLLTEMSSFLHRVEKTVTPKNPLFSRMKGLQDSIHQIQSRV